MSVSDFMSKDLVVVHPETPIFDAVDLMKQHDIHRLPVLKDERLVGLITEGIISAAMPSKATSLSVYEVNYLLNKTTVGDVMEKMFRRFRRMRYWKMLFLRCGKTTLVYYR